MVNKRKKVYNLNFWQKFDFLKFGFFYELCDENLLFDITISDAKIKTKTLTANMHARTFSFWHFCSRVNYWVLSNSWWLLPVSRKKSTSLSKMAIFFAKLSLSNSKRLVIHLKNLWYHCTRHTTVYQISINEAWTNSMRHPIDCLGEISWKGSKSK